MTAAAPDGSGPAAAAGEDGVNGQRPKWRQTLRGGEAS